jgi:putative YhbY family RNA-binding protein
MILQPTFIKFILRHNLPTFAFYFPSFRALKQKELRKIPLNLAIQADLDNECSIIKSMTALILTPAQRKSLKADAHDLSPVVMVGGDGLTPAVIKEAKLAINHHGLIKIRVFGDDREARVAMYEELCDKLDAAPVQHIGKLLVLWKPKDAVEEAFSNLGRSSKQTKKSLQAPRTKRQPNRTATKTGVRTSTSERSDRRSVSNASPFARAAAVKSTAPKKRVLRSEAAESKIGWSSPGYRKAAAAPAPTKKRKVRMSSTKKKSLGS